MLVQRKGHQGDRTIVKVARSPAEDLSVQRHHWRCEPSLLREFEHGDSYFFFLVLGPVWLDPPSTVAADLRGFLDARACSCPYHIRNPVFGTCTSDGKLSFGVEDV
jgi:hypothetical protein